MDSVEETQVKPPEVAIPPQPTPAQRRRLALWRILALVGIIALIAALFIFRDQVKQLQQYGYLGIFLISIAANATVIIPLPGVAFTTAMGAIFNPIGVAVAAGMGAAIGELSGYAAGFSGQGVIEKSAAYQRLTGWMRKHQRLAYLAIGAMAFVPNPLFDVAGMAAGALKLPIWKFLFACAIGKILKMLMFSYAGFYSVGWLEVILRVK
jgi:membrane protein YqaA with SNARE-associated domain